MVSEELEEYFNREDEAMGEPLKTAQTFEEAQKTLEGFLDPAAKHGNVGAKAYLKTERAKRFIAQHSENLSRQSIISKIASHTRWAKTFSRGKPPRERPRKAFIHMRAIQWWRKYLKAMYR